MPELTDNMVKTNGFQKGYVPTEEHRKRLSEAKKGKKLSLKHRLNIGLSQMGRKAWNKGVPEGEGNRWKGDAVGYSGIHMWVRKHLGKAKECTLCHKKANEGKIEWANIDHKYKRDLNDFISLCVSCHRRYDNERRTIYG